MRKSSRMAPKEKQTIEIEKTDRDPLLSFNQAVTVDCSDFLGTALMPIQQTPARSVPRPRSRATSSSTETSPLPTHWRESSLEFAQWKLAAALRETTAR